MEQKIKNIVNQTLNRETDTCSEDFWRSPLVAYADASDPMMKKLKTWIDPKHMLPQDMLPTAESVICFFLPFKEEISKSNRKGRTASDQWVESYIETNKLIEKINDNIKTELAKYGYACETTPATHNFDPEVLISYWSHRHLAYIAGLGTFGINNMLITDQGCSGRFGSCVTDLKLKPSIRPDSEYCLYKEKGTCGACVKSCVNGALTFDGFDRFKCYEMLLENDGFYDTGTTTDVCGKCIAGMPCAHKNPMK